MQDSSPHLLRRMEERGTDGGFGSLNSTIAAWRTETTTINANHQQPSPTCNEDNLISMLLTAIILLVGLAGNAAVLWLLGFRMRSNAISVYILNLAAADFLYLCIHTTSFLLDVIRLSISLIIPTYSLIRSGGTFCYITGLSMLSAISTERFLSVQWPIWYHCHRPTHASAIVCVLLWAVSLLLCFLDKLYCSFRGINFNKFHQCLKVNLFITGWLGFLLLILVGSSLALLGRVLCGSQRKRLTRLYVTTLLTVLVFLFCGLPFSLNLFLLPRILKNTDIVLCFYLVSVFLSCINSGANPIIYFFVGSFRQRLQQRHNLKLVLQKALQDMPEESENEGSLSQETLKMSGSRGAVRKGFCPGPQMCL